MASEHVIFQHAPTSTAAAFRALIEQLSTLRAPDQIQNCQAEILELQKGQYAYDLAFKLQHSAEEDANLHFFAALTIAIKINQEPAPTEAETSVLLPELLKWLVEAVNRRRPSMVMRRISTTLATLFCVPTVSWTNCVVHVAAALINGDAIVGGASLPNVSDVIARCEPRHIDALLGFCVILAEQLRDVAHNTIYDSVHKRAKANIEPLCELLRVSYCTNALASGPVLPTCHLQWLKYAKSSKAPHEDRLSLSSLLNLAMQLLNHSLEHEERFAPLCKLLEKSFKDGSIDIRKAELDTFTALLHGDVSRRIFGHLEKGTIEEEGVTAFSVMVLAFCKRQTDEAFSIKNDVSLNGLDEQSATYFAGVRTAIRELVQRITLPIVLPCCDEHLALAVVAFWEDFVQDTRSHTLRGEAQTFFLSTMSVLCVASQLSDLSDPLWKDEEDDFRTELRLRIRDLLQVAYEEYGMPVARTLVELMHMSGTKCMQQSNYASWHELEARLYFLTEISDSFHFSPEAEDAAAEDQAIGTVFAADWFGAILNIRNNVPLRVRRLALSTIGAFSGFFGRHNEALWAAMDAVIRCLYHPNLVLSASKTLKRVCAENRRVIAKAKQQPRLHEVTSTFFAIPVPRPLPVREDVLAMSATVAQALPPEQQLDAISRLLNLVLRDHEQQKYQTEAHPDQHTGIASESLGLLHSLAVAFQTPDDSSDYDRDESEGIDGEASRTRALWNSEEGQAVHKRIIIDLENYVRTGQAYEEELYNACDVLRAGYREHLPGPFVFGQDISVAFIASTPHDHPQYAAIAGLAYDFIAAHSAPNVRQDESITTLVVNMIAAMKRLAISREDPELSRKLLGTVTRASTACTNILLRLPPTELDHLLDFSFRSLRSPESLPKRAAAEFWASFTSALVKPASQTLDPALLDSFVRQFGPQLVAHLAANYAGAATRSDLDRLTEPLRGLAARMTSEVRKWLEQAIDDPAFDGGRSTAAQKRQFVGAVAMLRGSIKTRTAVKDFWFACRGVAAGYG